MNTFSASRFARLFSNDVLQQWRKVWIATLALAGIGLICYVTNVDPRAAVRPEIYAVLLSDRADRGRPRADQHDFRGHASPVAERAIPHAAVLDARALLQSLFAHGTGLLPVRADRLRDIRRGRSPDLG